MADEVWEPAAVVGLLISCPRCEREVEVRVSPRGCALNLGKRTERDCVCGVTITAGWTSSGLAFGNGRLSEKK